MPYFITVQFFHPIPRRKKVNKKSFGSSVGEKRFHHETSDRDRAHVSILVKRTKTHFTPRCHLIGGHTVSLVACEYDVVQPAAGRSSYNETYLFHLQKQKCKKKDKINLFTVFNRKGRESRRFLHTKVQREQIKWAEDYFVSSKGCCNSEGYALNKKYNSKRKPLFNYVIAGKTNFFLTTQVIRKKDRQLLQLIKQALKSDEDVLVFSKPFKN